MPLLKDGLDYFYLNVLVFLGNILIGCLLQRPVLVISSVICLAIIFYIREKDTKNHTIYLLDQITMLGVLLPGLYAWIESGPHKRLVAGSFFLTAAGLYTAGLAMTTFGHSVNKEDREFWRFVMHMFSTGGHMSLLLEPIVLYLVLGGKKPV